MFKYARILVLLMAAAAVFSSGCSSKEPQLGANSGLPPMPPTHPRPKPLN
jgi:hypothetical protein